MAEGYWKRFGDLDIHMRVVDMDAMRLPWGASRLIKGF